MTTRATEGFQQQAEENQPEPKIYTVRSWGDVATVDLPEVKYFWGNVFAAGQVQVIFGQGGLGKSRFALNLARNQVLALPFAGLDTGKAPLRHLFMGSENSIHRLQNDVLRMSKSLSVEQVNLLNDHIYMATLEQADDAYISLEDPENIKRWKKTTETFKPDILWVDPFGDVQIGDANGDAETRKTISELNRIAREHNAGAGVVIISHARTGAKNILQAIGYDSANFGKGSKALYSSARAVINMAPGDETEDPPLVLVNSKNNNGERLKSFAVRLNPEVMLYEQDEAFDMDIWMQEVQNAANSKRSHKRPLMTEDMAFEALGDETRTTTEATRILREKGATRDDANDLRKRLVANGRWEEWQPPEKNAPTYVGTPKAIKRRRKEYEKKKKS